MKALETGVFGAYFNVLINLKDVTDDAFKDQVGRDVGRARRGHWRLPSGRGSQTWGPGHLASRSSREGSVHQMSSSSSS